MNTRLLTTECFEGKHSQCKGYNGPKENPNFTCNCDCHKKRKIFVFGSNRQGRHGKGAALEAKQKWGAKYGQADGLQGNSYAIITKELRMDEDSVTLEEVEINIARFLNFARRHKEMDFYVTPLGTGLAGFKEHEILPLFDQASKNCILSWKQEGTLNFGGINYQK